jgi:hypothetical protein
VKHKHTLLTLLLAAALAVLVLDRSAHAEPDPALTRELVERMTRALEAQARQTERLVQAAERCKR